MFFGWEGGGSGGVGVGVRTGGAGLTEGEFCGGFGSMADFPDGVSDGEEDLGGVVSGDFCARPIGASESSDAVDIPRLKLNGTGRFAFKNSTIAKVSKLVNVVGSFNATGKANSPVS